MSTRTRRHHARLLVALGAASMALIAASPASAISRSYEITDEPTTTQQTLDTTNETTPVDENGKKSCAVAKYPSGDQWFPHGTTITVTVPNGGSVTVKCNDGEWEKVSRLASSTYAYRVDNAFVAVSG